MILVGEAVQPTSTGDWEASYLCSLKTRLILGNSVGTLKIFFYFSPYQTEKVFS